ncbi:MAG TPA: HAMP domain-containing histidine kinase [Campylobacterales bacterium]|nr:HAMP domain-containing histidine kinase [Campylobacterales bacterium]
MNRHSIFLKLNLLFVVAIVSISIVFFIFTFIGKKHKIGLYLNDARHVMRIIKSNPPNLALILKEEGFEMIKNKEKILNNASSIVYPKSMPPFIQKRLLAKKIEILRYDSDIYFHINLPKHHYLIKNGSYPNMFRLLLFVYLTIISLMVIIYIELKRSLSPIRELEFKIKSFGDGACNIDTRSDKKDEIAAVGNQFYNAVQKINALQNTRTLFLRNMMHELKTPITKGKLSLSLMEENSESAMLEKVFHKLDTLINEMADIERISTQNIEIEKKTHRLIDIVDHAEDLLYLEEHQLAHNITDQSLACDFKLFGIAVKNLIENGIKYGRDKKVEIKVDIQSIQFINSSEPLKHEFTAYLEPFCKGELTLENQKGFGLGLYIVSEIMKIHDFSLEYRHEDGKNIFIITPS